MRKNYVKNYVHLLIICIPLLLLLIACIFPNKQTTNKYALEETTTTQQVQYKYQTNEINTIDDIVQGHIYYLDIGTALINGFDIESNLVILGNELNIVSQINIDEYYISSDNGNIYNTNTLYIDSLNDRFYLNVYNFAYETDCYVMLTGENIIQDFKNSYNDGGVYCIIDSFNITRNGSGNITEFINGLTTQDMNNYCPKETINNITNNIYNQEALTQVNETKQINTNIIKPINDFYNLSINDWYRDMLDLIGISYDSNNIVKTYIAYQPLWLLWFFLFELIEVCLIFIPRCIMVIIRKLSGDSEV